MKYNTSFVNNNEIKIHYIDSINQADNSLYSLIICPGLSEIAEEYIDLMEYLLPRRAIALSFRGRGKSETPKTGYNLQDHVSDIEHIVDELKLTQFHLFGNSRGVSYALG